MGVETSTHYGKRKQGFLWRSFKLIDHMIAEVIILEEYDVMS